MGLTAACHALSQGYADSRKTDEQTSRQGNLHYLYKVCKQRLSRKTNLLVSPYSCQPVYY